MAGAISRQLGTHAITIYSGTQPTADDFVTNWAASYTSDKSNFLAHYTGARFTIVTEGPLATLTTIPSAVNAAHDGTGAWAVLWQANQTQSTMGTGSTIPTSSLMIVPVTATGGTGVIRFADLTFTSGVSKVIASGNLGSTF